MKAKPDSTTVNIDLRVALVYALFGGLWILLSDHLLEAFITDTSTLSKMQTYKGWVFVALSALLIYSLLKRELSLRRIAEKGLRESETQLKDAQRLAHIGSSHWDAATNTSTWSDELYRILGWDPALPKPTQTEQEKLYTPKSFLLISDAARQALATGKPYDIELEIVRPDGVRRQTRARGSVVRDESGSITGLNNTLEDITERKQAEQDMHRYKLLSVHSRDIILFINRHDGRILEANAAAELAYGYSRDELLALTIRDLRAPEVRNLTAEQMAQADTHGILFETTHIRKDGSRFPAEVSSQGVNVGDVRTLMSIIRDITGRKQAEDELRVLNDRLEQRVVERTAELYRANVELERASHAKDEFLATMSHELRTPLNSILGLSETLLEERRGSLNEYQQKSLRIIESSGEHLLELINDILDLSKIEAGKLDYHPQSVLVEDVCRSSLTFVRSQAARKSITITYENQSLVERISADDRRLKQILVNLLANAVKFTPENGHVCLRVTTKAERDLIQFSVIDDGVGIAPESLERLFRPFVQLDSSLGRQHEGTGLGLALVQKLTDLHGGSVQVESEVGKGSCFTVSLNCKQDAIPNPEKSRSFSGPHTILQADKGRNSSQGSASRGVILLAEDNLPNILTIGEYLESHGYEVIVAHDGSEALAKTEEFNPDLILMDIQMPIMNGLDAIAHLRAKHRFVSIPIIALTALAMPGDRERCLQMGANEYMSKPVSLKMLVTAINAMLDPHGGHVQ